MSKTGIYCAYHQSLRRWKVVEVELKSGETTRHVYGHEVSHDVRLASSPIKSFDRDAMLVTTQSGSHYRLQGLPGTSSLADNAWLHWCRSNHVVRERDVTHEYMDVSKVSIADFEKLIHLSVEETGGQ